LGETFCFWETKIHSPLKRIFVYNDCGPQEHGSTIFVIKVQDWCIHIPSLNSIPSLLAVGSLLGDFNFSTGFVTCAMINAFFLMKH
jgi:hypothetical protein